MSSVSRSVMGAASICALAFSALALPASPAAADEPQASPAAQELPEPPADMPDSFKQVIPRGRIASVDQPVFVGPDEAEIADEAWVLGVAVDGVAKAYSLNLLNRHEIVNDRFGDAHVAAVW